MREHDDLTLVADGIDFGEGPRWHDGRLWYSDFYQHRICSIGIDGDRRNEFEDLADQPSGLGWLPDGSLLVVFMQTRIVVREENGMLVTHADISHLTKFMANDMVVHENGNAYVGNFGFDFAHGEAYQPADLVLVRPDGSAETAAKDLAFPNGCVITPDGGTLIVGETFGSGYQAFTINADGTLSDKRQWAKVDGTFPDGCALDDDGGIWFADALGGQVLRVVEGGEVTDRVATPQGAFACMLGGPDGDTLYIIGAPGPTPADAEGKAAGTIHAVPVPHRHAGKP